MPAFDRSLLDYEWFVFNAADLKHNIVVRSQDYLLAASPAALLGFAKS